MTRDRAVPDFADTWIFRTEVAATRPAGDYTPRLVPRHPTVSVPLEASEILWQR